MLLDEFDRIKLYLKKYFKSAQSTLEYTLLLAIVIGVLVFGLREYIKPSLNLIVIRANETIYRAADNLP